MASKDRQRVRDAAVPVTLEEHIRWGQAIKEIRDRFAGSAGVGRIANLLASELEHLLCAQVPRERDPRNLAIQVYFGTDRRLVTEWEVGRTAETDAFFNIGLMYRERKA